MMYLAAGLVVIGLINLLATLVLSEIGSPTWLELPWSGFEDFVEAEGILHVAVHPYSRVLRYDRTGRFVDARPIANRSRGDVQLAADSEGHVYVKIANAIFVYDRWWNLQGRAVEGFRRDGRWVLGNGAQPMFETVDDEQAPVDRPALPGDVLFTTGRSGGRHEFRCADHTVLQRAGSEVVRFSRGGERLALYRGPWYLWWARWPIPGLPLWMAGLLGLLALARFRGRAAVGE